MSRKFSPEAALALLFLAAASPVGAASTQLSAGHPFSDIDLAVTLPQISPDGQYAVYGQDAVTDGAFELWSVPLAGGAPVRLSDVLSANQHVSFAISPNSARVVYVVDQDTPGKAELYSVPIAGGAATKLNPPLTANRGVLNFKISPASDRVFYVCDRFADSMFELFTVPLAGGNSIRLNHPLPFDYDVEGYQATPNGQTVLYRAGRTDSGDWELYSVDADGQGPIPVKVNLDLTNNGAVDPYFQISPNSAQVVYLADATVDGQFDLYSVPVGGGTSTKLNSSLPTGASVGNDFLINANSSRVVYRADQTALNVFQLYSVGLDGQGATLLNGPLLSTEDVSTGFRISANSAKVVYRSDERVNDVIELWSVPIAGGTPTRLNGELVDPGGDVLDYALSPDSARVVYRADQNVDALNELWSVPIGGGIATKLNRTLTNGGDVQNFRISENSNWVVYGADQDVDTVDKLLRAPIVGGTVENVSGVPIPGGEAVVAVVQAPAYAISPANSYDVVYAADEDVNDEVELYLSGVPEVEPDACTPDAGTLCLQNDKFQINVTWRDFTDRTGIGRATPLSPQSGDFWFFNAQSNELIVKIIDGCGSTGRYWVFWRALSNVEMDLVIRDTETLQTLTYHNPLGFNSNGHLDIATIFHCDGSGPAAQTIDTSTDLPAPGPPQLIERQGPVLGQSCVPNGDHSICLGHGRFRVEGTWSDFSGGSGYAHLIKKNEGSGYAWFFNSNNYEMLFKLVDGCSFNGNTWVSIAGLTNVAASLTITDTWTGTIYRQENLLAVDFPTNLDIETNLTYCGPAPF